MKIVFCGFGRAGQETLGQLLVCYDIAIKDIFVFTHDDKSNQAFCEFVEYLGIHYSKKNINDSIEELKRFQPDYLISAYYRIIVKGSVLELVGHRAMNLHPALLPDYKGCFSGCWAILNGEVETGVSFHYMTNQIDGGNIIYQKKLAIHSKMTAFELYHRQISAFISGFGCAAGKFFADEIGVSQDKYEGRYYPRELPHQGQIDAEEVDFAFANRFVRAMYFPPFPPARIKCQNETVDVSSIEQLAHYKHWFDHE